MTTNQLIAKLLEIPNELRDTPIVFEGYCGEHVDDVMRYSEEVSKIIVNPRRIVLE